jgi:hypothetical protein
MSRNRRYALRWYPIRGNPGPWIYLRLKNQRIWGTLHEVHTLYQEWNAYYPLRHHAYVVFVRTARRTIQYPAAVLFGDG